MEYWYMVKLASVMLSAKRTREGPSQEGRAPKSTRRLPLEGKTQMQLRLNQHMTTDMVSGYASDPKALQDMLFAAGYIKHAAVESSKGDAGERSPASSKVAAGEQPSKIVLNQYLREQLEQESLDDVDQLVPLMLEKCLCKQVETFKIKVRRHDGVEVTIILDEELRRYGDLTRKIDRIMGIPRHTVELYWFAEKHQQLEDEDSVVTVDTIFNKECTLALNVDKAKSRRPNYVTVLLKVLKDMLDDATYAELRQRIDTLKERQCPTSERAEDKAKLLHVQIESVVDPDKTGIMRNAHTRARLEMKKHKDRMKKFEELLLHLLRKGSPDEVPEADKATYNDLSKLLSKWQKHKAKAAKKTAAGGGGDDDKDDEDLKTMHTILEYMEDPEVCAQLCL